MEYDRRVKEMTNHWLKDFEKKVIIALFKYKTSQKHMRQKYCKKKKPNIYQLENEKLMNEINGLKVINYE